ncbi:MAG: group II intron reverse transcriptase/maturase [Cyanobacteria bacterium REEB67]|nr:group II intron reverse transcriptase/maturase [Cyanobacteria bacterium REEB67]
MRDKRQKKRIKPASEVKEESEALGNALRGFEPQMAACDTESLAVAEQQIMEEMLDQGNLEQALKRVMQNQGAAGIDRMTVDKLPAYLVANWKTIRHELLQGTYVPRAVKRVEIPKPTGGVRQLGIPSVVDRFIQQALQQVLQKHWDGQFSQYSYGFRPGKSQHQAIKQAQQYVSSGLRYVVDIDLEKFFDRVNHDVLMGRVAKRVSDKRVLKLVRAFLNSGMMEDGLMKPTEEGVPQGGPLSPILSNLLLDDLDQELEKRGLRFVRYADDCNIYVASQRAGDRVMESITNFLSTRLRLKVNEAKSAVGRPWERKFLGFTFTWTEPPRRRIAPTALARVKAKIRNLTIRKRGSTLTDVIEELNSYLRGWINYFGFCETPTVLQALEKWIRHKLRCLIWKRWKRGSTRYQRLRALGLNQHQAALGAGNGSHGPWRMSATPPVQAALTNAYFRSLGLLDLRCYANA